MIEKISDFNGIKFENLWGDFSCECVIDDISSYVMFFKDNDVRISLSGDDANDVLDFVLSKFYSSNDTTIEDGFNSWLIERYNNIVPTFGNVESNNDNDNDDIPLPVLYATLLKSWKMQEKIIKKQKREIKRLKEKVEKYSIKNYEMRKQLERYGSRNASGEELHETIVTLNNVIAKRNAKIQELVEKLKEK